MRRSFLLFTFYFFSTVSFAQNVPQGPAGKPKLVVGLMVDQMRWDYLYRFNSLYGPNGFKRLLNQGFSNENAMIPCMPTYTAVGHSCVYCTEDSTVKTVGSTSGAGIMSPANMWTTTITDELRLSNNFKSKVIGIALKDR